MGAPNPRAFNGMYMLLGFLGVGLALAIIIIVDQKLWTYIGGYWGWNYVVYQDDCYLGWTGTAGDSTNLCYFNWTTASIGAFIWLVVWFMAICSRNPGGKSSGPFAIMFLLAIIVWAVSASINQSNIPDANAAAPPEDILVGWRNSILALSWTAFGVSILGLVAAGMDISKNKPVPVQQQQPQFYSGPPPGQYPPPPGQYPPPPGAAPMYGAPPPAQNYPPAGPPPPTFYPVPGAGAPPPNASYQPAPGAYQPPPAGYPPAGQY